MRSRLHNCVLALFVLLFFEAGSQSPDPENILFSPFFAEKDLSSLNITCFFQDHLGYMWIGTEDGLNYFNGKTVKVFRHDRLNKNSLIDNTVGSVCEDKDGNIWIGTSYGISKLDPENFQFENYLKDEQGHGLDFKIRVYADQDNTIWAFSGSLFRLNAEKNVFQRIEFVQDNGKDKIYAGLFQDSRKRYWLSSDKYLYRFYPKENKKVLFADSKKAMYFFKVCEDARGHLFCGTWNNGIFRIDTLNRSLTSIGSDGGLTNTLAFQKFNEREVLWFGSRLSTYDLQTEKHVYYASAGRNNYTARYAEVSAMYTDRQNQLWIGYVNKGVQIVSPANQLFHTYRISEKEGMFPMVNCYVKGRYFSYAGGWYNHSLVRLDQSNKPVRTWKTILPGIKQTENNISDGWSDGKGSIWFTTAFGLARFDELSEKTELFSLDTSISRRSFFLRILPEGDSVLWLSGYFSGLSRFSLRTRTFQNWGGKQRALYWDVARDDKGILWLADNSGILTGFDPVTKTFRSKNYNHLTEGVIYNSILYDSIRNVIWIGCSNGLLRVDMQSFEGKLFTDKDNLPTSQVNAVQCDKNGNLWIATNKGLCFYEPGQGVFKTFFSNSGLPGATLNQLFRLQSNGDLYIGCEDGFSVFKTGMYRTKDTAQCVSIMKVSEGGKIISFREEEGLKTLSLTHDQDNIQVEFSFNDLTDPEDNQLLYRVGSNEAWNISPDGIVNFSKLSPGTYTLQVSAINHNGLRSLRNDLLVITVHPPFWRQAWFILLVSLCVIALILLGARYVFTRNLREKILVLEKEQAVEKERSRISQDMHDELGSGLTKISILSEVAKTQLNDHPKAKTQLESISASSRELVDNLQDIIWILNSRNDSLENLCAYLQEYVLNYFEAGTIAVQIHFPEKIPAWKLSEDQRRNILLVFKETLNNITKHSSCTQVTVAMEQRSGSVQFTISDNGKGFEKDKIRHFANGLQNMEKRMTAIHGTFAISSARDKGVVSVFEFAP